MVSSREQTLIRLDREVTGAKEELAALERALSEKRVEVARKEEQLAVFLGLRSEFTPSAKPRVMGMGAGANPRFRDGVRVVLHERPGSGPSAIWARMRELGYDSTSSRPSKMVSIALYDMKRAGAVENRDGGWYLTN